MIIILVVVIIIIIVIRDAGSPPRASCALPLYSLHRWQQHSAWCSPMRGLFEARVSVAGTKF